MIQRVKALFKITSGQLTFTHMRHYMGAVYLAQGIAVLRSFINARFLGPHDYGFWGWLVFIISFGYFVHLGVQEIMLKDVPALQAKGREAEAQRLIQMSFTFYLSMLLAGAVLMGFLSLVLPGATSTVQQWGWIVAGVVMIVEVLFYFEQVVARSLGYFSKIGKTLFVTNVISLFLTCLLVIPYGIAGIYWVAVLTPVFGFGFLHRYTRYPIKFVWVSERLKRMIHNGWPIVAMGLCFLAVSWVDRWIVMKYLGVVPHGFYTLGASISLMLFLFPKGLADVLEPKLHFGHSREPSGNSIKSNFLKPVLILAWLMPGFLLMGHVFLPLVVKLFLPDYLPGLMVIRILIWTSFLGGLMAMTKSSLVALGYQKQTLPVILFAIVINMSVSLWMVQQGYGVAGVAVGSAVALGIVSLWLILLVLRGLNQPWRVSFQYLLEIYLPFAILSLPCLAQAWADDYFGGTFGAWLIGLQAVGMVAYFITGLYLFSRRLTKWEIERNTVERVEVTP